MDVAAPTQMVVRPLDQPGDLGWVVMAHGERYSSEFGWDTSIEAMAARIVADFANDHDPAREAAWIAEVDGRRVGCVLCVAGDERDTAVLRVLLVDPAGRGLGVGRRLVEQSLEFARGAGYRRMTLWTNDVLASARRLYEATGFELVSQESHHSFGHDLVGEYWAREL